MKADEITMNQGERRKLYIIRQMIEGTVKQWKAAEILGMCVRQVGRLMKRVKKEGDVGIVHRSRGKISKRSIGEGDRRRIVKLCRNRYVGFGPTLVSEKVFEEEEISVSKETIRKWMISEKLEYSKRRKRPHRSWRPRKEHSGEMVQMDGSHHKWFEDRGPKAVLIAYIDDATNRVFARFYNYEGTLPALDSLKRYIRHYGIPCSLYLDRHTTYKGWKEFTIEDQLSGVEQTTSQFKAAAQRQGIEVIHAYSPQAKGRIERLFDTLQDRLVKEMRLHNINNVEEGNKFLKIYLPAFNKRFQIKPAEKEDLHRILSRGMRLEWILCKQETRALRKDFTVCYEKNRFQVLDNVRTKRITVQQSTNGRFRLIHNGCNLRFKKIPGEVLKKPEMEKVDRRRPPRHHSGPDHPWTKFRLPGSTPHLP